MGTGTDDLPVHTSSSVSCIFVLHCFSLSSVCLLVTSSTFMPSFTCLSHILSNYPALEKKTLSNLFSHPFLSYCLCDSVWTRTRAKQPVSASCPYLHVALLTLPLSGIVPVQEGERSRERESNAERTARGKEERQGNKRMHADAGPISFTNMQIQLPLWYANERLQSAN